MRKNPDIRYAIMYEDGSVIIDQYDDEKSAINRYKQILFNSINHGHDIMLTKIIPIIKGKEILGRPKIEELNADIQDIITKRIEKLIKKRRPKITVLKPPKEEEEKDDTTGNS